MSKRLIVLLKKDTLKNVSLEELGTEDILFSVKNIRSRVFLVISIFWWLLT